MNYIMQLKKLQQSPEYDELTKQWEQHKRQGDIGYAYRTERKRESKRLWAETTLPPPSHLYPFPHHHPPWVYKHMLTFMTLPSVTWEVGDEHL
jgi:hypothetical protein